MLSMFFLLLLFVLQFIDPYCTSYSPPITPLNILFYCIGKLASRFFKAIYSIIEMLNQNPLNFDRDEIEKRSELNDKQVKILNMVLGSASLFKMKIYRVGNRVEWLECLKLVETATNHHHHHRYKMCVCVCV